MAQPSQTLQLVSVQGASAVNQSHRMLVRAFAVLRSSGGAQGSVFLSPARMAISMGLLLPSRGPSALSAAGNVAGVHNTREQAVSGPASPRAATVLSRPVWHTRQQHRSLWRPWKKAKTDELEDECHLQAPSGHRPVLKMDLDRCIHVGGQKLTEAPLAAFGLRIQDNFCTELQAHMVLMEVHELLIKYGYSLPDDHQPFYTMSSLREVTMVPAANSNTVRCCGRRQSHYHPNKPADKVAPWGSGDSFDINQVPPKLRSVMQSIQNSPLFSLGNPRSISINKRRNSFFKLDPHINGIEEGENIFVLNLNSNVVYTFTPPGQYQRSDPVKCATQSWSDKDIDVLLRHRTLMLTSGSSRREWRHAVRSGVQVQLDGGEQALCDWWGTTRNLVRRSPEKVAVVFGFDKTEVELEKDADSTAAHPASESIGRW